MGVEGSQSKIRRRRDRRRDFCCSALSVRILEVTTHGLTVSVAWGSYGFTVIVDMAAASVLAFKFDFAPSPS